MQEVETMTKIQSHEKRPRNLLISHSISKILSIIKPMEAKISRFFAHQASHTHDNRQGPL